MENIIKYFSVGFFFCYMLVAFVLPTIRTYRQTGINPITFGGEDNAHNYVGKWFKIVIALIPIVIACAIIGTPLYSYLLPAFYLKHNSIQWIGIALCVGSFVWTATAQWQMGTAWRIGIDDKHKTPLLQTGLFSVSRNPIFLGMLITLIGFFLMLPNALTMLILVAGYLLIQIQIRLEEDFLSKQHGLEYHKYKTQTRRFL
jgi:protein-S-isoprenylcysteine O-methyltransferase Ste14